MNQPIYQTNPGDDANARLSTLPDPPPWRRFDQKTTNAFEPDGFAVRMVNAAMILRRPLLVTGDPGCGKTSLAAHVAQQFNLPGPFRWSITSRSVLQDGLYQYDALGRLNEIQIKNEERLRPKAATAGESPQKPEEESSEDIGRYLRLGPVGMAFAVTQPKRPAVLLIDEFDKCDLDLPGDLLHLFEEGCFDIPELQRLSADQASVMVMPCNSRREGCAYAHGGANEEERIPIIKGHIVCSGDFPLVIITSNGEREFPPALLRRCLSLNVSPPSTAEGFGAIVARHFPGLFAKEGPDMIQVRKLIEDFAGRSQESIQSPDQLLNLVNLALEQVDLNPGKDTKGDEVDFVKAVTPTLGIRQPVE